MKFFTNFAAYARQGLSQRDARDAALCELRNIDRALRHFDRHVDAAVIDPRLTARSKHFLRTLWYGDPRDGALTLGNRAVQRAAMVSSLRVLMMHVEEDPLARSHIRRWRMLTTAPDVGISDFERPALNPEAVCRNWYTIARKAGVDAFGRVDISVVDQHMDLEPLKVALHMHAVIRAQDNSFRPKRAELLASPRRENRNACGLKIVNIRSKQKDGGLPLTWANVADLGYYAGKMTCGIDVVFTKWKRRQTKTTQKGWTMIHALRQLECYSHCDALKTARGLGKEGCRLRSRWKASVLRLLKFDGKARGLAIDHVRLEESWSRIWTELGDGMRAAAFV